MFKNKQSKTETQEYSYEQAGQVWKNLHTTYAE